MQINILKFKKMRKQSAPYNSHVDHDQKFTNTSNIKFIPTLYIYFYVFGALALAFEIILNKLFIAAPDEISTNSKVLNSTVNSVNNDRCTLFNSY